MGANLGPSNEPEFLSEINVTPLVDVMLVLLIIFMISTPLMVDRIPIHLPKTKQMNKKNQENIQLVVTLESNGKISYEEKSFSQVELIKKLSQDYEKSERSVIFLKADEKTNYGIVAKLLSEFKLAGLARVSLVTDIQR
jgi:biopolymer transport protein TolR